MNKKKDNIIYKMHIDNNKLTIYYYNNNTKSQIEERGTEKCMRRI